LAIKSQENEWLTEAKITAVDITEVSDLEITNIYFFVEQSVIIYDSLCIVKIYLD